MEPSTKARYKTIEEYHSAFPEKIKQVLEKLRAIIKKAAPQAEEVISYNMPAFRLNGILVYYAAWKEHIGFYPTSSGIAAFREELTSWTCSKGAVQFPLNKPLPSALITKMVRFRVNENLAKSASRSKGKTSGS